MMLAKYNLPVCPIDDTQDPKDTSQSEDNKSRCKLASAFRLLDVKGWSSHIYNYISVWKSCLFFYILHFLIYCVYLFFILSLSDSLHSSAHTILHESIWQTLLRDHRLQNHETRFQWYNNYIFIYLTLLFYDFRFLFLFQIYELLIIIFKTQRQHRSARHHWLWLLFARLLRSVGHLSGSQWYQLHHPFAWAFVGWNLSHEAGLFAVDTRRIGV